jgi:enoyl-CoA hydratase/carnithine racemase
MGECVFVAKSEGAAMLTRNRPEQLNAMSYQFGIELHDAVTRVGADDEVGCIVSTVRASARFQPGRATGAI